MKNLYRVGAVALAYSIVIGCGQEEMTNDSTLQEAANISQSQALNAPKAIVVDLSTNRACYRESGASKSCWNVGSGRDYLNNQNSHPASGDLTPTGTYYIHQIEVCPKYFPRQGQAKGPCASNNPLGTRALWFRAGRLYGLHGTSQPGLLDRGNRRVSGGCVRNKNSQIEWVYSQIKGNYKNPRSSWEASSVATAKPGKQVPVVVGKFNGRFDSISNSGVNISLSCKIEASEVNVRNQPNTSTSSVVDVLENGTRNIHAIKDFGEWYQVSYRLGGERFDQNNKAFIKKFYNNKPLISCR